MTDEKDDDPPTPIGEIVSARAAPAPLTPVQERLCDRAAEIMEGDPKDVLYQHTALCQTYFPYRDPKTIRRWSRSNGRMSILMQAGEVIDPVTMEFRQVGLPFGSKARLVVAHLNTRALHVGSNVIPIEEGSFTAFVKSMQDPLHDKAPAPNGRELRAYREQFTRFSVARLTLAVSLDERRAVQADRQIIERLEVVWERHERQRVLWPDTITLTPEYWASLQKHAVPLDARALAALAHSALALDIYQWLAQRLHRIPAGQSVAISRVLLHQQFGGGYASERRFWQVFKVALRQVLAVYNQARISLSEEGIFLRNSLPSVPRRFHVVRALDPINTPGSTDVEMSRAHSRPPERS
ncbi:MAG: replication protein RepA [Myxococcales bacterium]